MILLYTGNQRIASDIAKNYIYKLRNTKKNTIFKILECVKECKKILKSKKINEFGKLMHESWLFKKELSNLISNTAIDEMYYNGIKAGALGGKILGAGGGGFMLFYVEKDKQKFFLRKMNKFLKIDFKFSDQGSEIVYNDEF